MVIHLGNGRRSRRGAKPTSWGRLNTANLCRSGDERKQWMNGGYLAHDQWIYFKQDYQGCQNLTFKNDSLVKCSGYFSALEEIIQ